MYFIVHEIIYKLGIKDMKFYIYSNKGFSYVRHKISKISNGKMKVIITTWFVYKTDAFRNYIPPFE